MPHLASSAPGCDDEVLTLFSSGEYKTLTGRYSPTESKVAATDPSVRIGLAAIYQWGIAIESSRSSAAELLLGLAKNETEKVIAHWGDCARANNIAARMLLGIVYYDGLGVRQNLEAAKHWFGDMTAPLARLGLAATYHRLGRNEAVEPLIEEVIAAPQSLNTFEVAELYYHGIIFDQDYASASKWYEKSAKDGSYAALGILGYMYTIGLGVERSQEKARYWFERQSSHPDFKTSSGGSTLRDVYSNQE